MASRPSTGKRDFNKKLDPNKRPWHKQPGETTKAFEAFMIYLMSGPTRTMVDTAKILGKGQALIYRWASQWHWSTRAGAYEEHYMLLRLESAEADRDAMYVKQREIAASALQIVEAKMAAVLEEVDDEGKLTNDSLRMDALVRLLDTATKVERMAVLGRIDAHERSAQEQEKLEERYSDELASFTRDLINGLGLSPEQEEKAKDVLAELLVKQEAQ